MLVGIGSLVLSMSGRDKDKYFLVVKLENDYVYLCDGDVRKVDNPKKKKLKHIELTNYYSEDINKKINKNIKISNKEVQKVIKNIISRGDDN